MSAPSSGRLRGLIIPVLGLVVAACGSAGGTGPLTSGATPGPTALTSNSPSARSSAGPTGSGAPATEAPGGATSGDVPDNAVFLTYHGSGPAFAIQYVEGWQVTPQADGVVVRDKDSSETVVLVAPQSDVAAYISGTDLPALRAQPGFALIKQDSVTVGSATYAHLAYHQLSPPDSVTGKQVLQTADRYFVPGSAGLAIVTLATPDGVDNVDAFRLMIESFTWS